MIYFDIAKGWEGKDVILPIRKTAQSAGYDFTVAADIIIPSYSKLASQLYFTEMDQNGIVPIDQVEKTRTLTEIAAATKATGAKPTLVPTGVKCHLEPDTYLELSVRSSTPLKYWLIMANSVGIIDADYFGNPDNDGHIYFQMINLSPWDIQLKKGDQIGQGIIKNYLTTSLDSAAGLRKGGFGSTNE